MQTGLSLGRFQRISLGHLPTPLQPLQQLSEHLGGPSIHIKRDDCTGLALGGNKTRKLEFLVADALTRDADILVTQGGTQSNHVRQSAAAARVVGMRCLALLERLQPSATAEYEVTGNVLLDDLLQCEHEFRDAGSDMNAEVEALGEMLRQQGHRPYTMPGGGSTAIGALGYVDCAVELLQQADEAGMRIDRIVHATASAGTQAGLVAALHALGESVKVTGISIGTERESQIDKVHRLAVETAALLGTPEPPPRALIDVRDDYVGDGYAEPTDAMRSAVQRLAAEHGILLDPVYTGKAMAGLLDLVDGGELGRDENVVFIHTGGVPALFAYRQLFSRDR